jgi:hypothetical protein
MRSKFGKINIRDVVRGTIYSFSASVVTALATGLQTGEINANAIVLTGVSTALGYLSTKLLQNENGEFKP